MTAHSGWNVITANQADKEGAIGTNFGKLDAFVSDEKDVDVNSGTTTYTMSDSDTQLFYHFSLNPNGGSPPTAGQLKTLALGNIRKAVLVSNFTLADFSVSRSGGDTVFLGPGTNALIYIDGTSLRVASTGNAGNSFAFQTVRVAHGSNVTIATALNNGDILQGVTLATGDDVLLFGQSTGSQNGAYEVAASPARSPFADNTGEIRPNTMYYVREGTYAGMFFYCTNTTVPAIGSDTISFARLASSIPYVLHIHFGGTPTVNSLVWRLVASDISFSLPDDLAGSVGRVTTNPSSSTAFDVKKNGVSVGTITVDTSGVFTFVTGGASPIEFAVGDYLEVVAPANLNGLADLSFTLKGYR